jgi:hypothetical protein
MKDKTPTGISALASMGIGGGAAFLGGGEESVEMKGDDEGVQGGAWGNATEKIKATNPAAELGDLGTFRPTFLQQAGLHPDTYLSR